MPLHETFVWQVWEILFLILVHHNLLSGNTFFGRIKERKLFLVYPKPKMLIFIPVQIPNTEFFLAGLWGPHFYLNFTFEKFHVAYWYLIFVFLNIICVKTTKFKVQLMIRH